MIETPGAKIRQNFGKSKRPTPPPPHVSSDIWSASAHIRRHTNHTSAHPPTHAYTQPQESQEWVTPKQFLCPTAFHRWRRPPRPCNKLLQLISRRWGKNLPSWFFFCKRAKHTTAPFLIVNPPVLLICINLSLSGCAKIVCSSLIE